MPTMCVRWLLVVNCRRACRDRSIQPEIGRNGCCRCFCFFVCGQSAVTATLTLSAKPLGVGGRVCSTILACLRRARRFPITVPLILTTIVEYAMGVGTKGR
jgi:hypothetical protein